MYLGEGLEGLRGTFFRQTMFAEFELALYEATKRGEALTGDRITEMYGEILRRYHGHDDGVDLAQPEPYLALVAKMNTIMDEMERLLDEQGGQ